MAMRGRGRGNPSRPPRLIVGRVYDQFKPMSEWRQEDDYDTLLVYLPGFQKEYIKVTTEDVNIVRVRGERLVTENKWSRFQEDFRVPENCEMRGIRARFDGGILTITMPRKTINESPPPPPITASTAAPTRVPPKTDEQPFAAPTRMAPKTEEQPFRRNNQEALPKPKEETKENKPNKPPQSSPLENKTLPPQAIPPPTSSYAPTKQEPIKTVPKAKETIEDFMFGSLPTSVPKKDKHDVVEKENDVKKTDLDKGKEPLVQENMKMMDFEGKSGKSNDGGRGGFQGGKPDENKVAARRWMDEDRKLLVNVGVGVLVIVALGVHVSYTIGLIGKGK